MRAHGFFILLIVIMADRQDLPVDAFNTCAVERKFRQAVEPHH